MENKIRSIIATALTFFTCTALANEMIFIKPHMMHFNETVNWTSNNSSDSLTIQALGTYFTVHLSVSSSSASSISFTCANNSPVVIPPGSNIVCFVDDGFSASWASTSGLSSASGTYEML